MKDYGLSQEERDRVLTFEGYGNKSAPYWFLGMEESSDSIEELQERARSFHAVEYLHSFHARIGLDTKYRHVPTWRVMSKLIMAMQRVSGWEEAPMARESQANELGQADGESFLTELMPLPARSIGEWLYPLIFPTRDQYNAEVRLRRIMWLRTEITKFHPSLVICYGKGNWLYYRNIFSDVKFSGELDKKICVGHREQSTFLLLPFLSYDLFSTSLITRIADLFAR